MKSGILLDSYRLPLIRGLEAAAVAGVDGVQFYAKGGQEELTLRTAEELRAFRREAETLHLELAALCMELGGHGFRNSAENPAKLAAAEAVLHIAGQLEIPVVTTHIGVIPALPDSPIYVEMLRSMRLLGGAAARRGITIGIVTDIKDPDKKNRVKVRLLNRSDSAQETDYRDDGTVHWTITRVSPLYEISPCTFPAYQDTTVSARKRDLEEIKRKRADVWKHEALGRLRQAGRKE